MRSLFQRIRIKAVAVVVGGALAVGGCTESDPGQPGGSPAPGGGAPAAGRTGSAELTVVDGRLRRTTWAIARRLHVAGEEKAQKLPAPVQSQFVGTLSPAAVTSPGDERVIAYSAFHRKRPVIRVRDVRRRADSIVDEGAYTLAWGREGGLAYFRGLTARVEDPARHTGHVVVRSSPASAPVQWTADAGRYAVSAWAGKRLVVHELGEEWPRLVVYDGPKRRRVLAERAALVAVSPDGTRAVVTKQPDPSPIVAVVDVASGRELGSFAFSDHVDPLRGQKISFVADSGGWGGETVIAAATGGLAVFRVAGDRITLEQLLGLDPDAFPTGLSEPRSDPTGRLFVAAAELMQRPRAGFSRTALMECDRIERRCVLGRSAPSFLPPRAVYNPSRP